LFDRKANGDRLSERNDRRLHENGRDEDGSLRANQRCAQFKLAQVSQFNPNQARFSLAYSIQDRFSDLTSHSSQIGIFNHKIARIRCYGQFRWSSFALRNERSFYAPPRLPLAPNNVTTRRLRVITSVSVKLRPLVWVLDQITNNVALVNKLRSVSTQ
jgi:hypothetical protein